MSKTALFKNWTNESFTGYWDGKPRSFKPGQSEWMPEFLAKHFAKHLTNRELLRTDAEGNLIHKHGDKMTSPKFPEQVPTFMELFNKAYQSDKSSEASSETKNELDTDIDVANRNKGASSNESPSQENEDDFQGKPVDDND